MFPGVELPKPDYDADGDALHEACAEMNLQPDPYFFLEDDPAVRDDRRAARLMIVGQPFSGKTMLATACSRARCRIMAERGEEDQVKCEFSGEPEGDHDGAAVRTERPADARVAGRRPRGVVPRLRAGPSPNRKWVMLDGPVDAIWIENMNTVLDDNKKLCLNAARSSRCAASMNMIFEVSDLAVASPATVSRCGMVYLEPSQLGWRPALKSWLRTMDGRLARKSIERVEGLFEWALPPMLAVKKRALRAVSPASDANLAASCRRLFKARSISHWSPYDRVGVVNADP